jgi:hypothetical protein
MSEKKSRNPFKQFEKKLSPLKSADSADNIASPETAVIQQSGPIKTDGTPIVSVLKRSQFQWILMLTSEQTEVLIEGIEVATREFANADLTIYDRNEQIRVDAFKWMKKSLNIALAVVKAVVTNIYAQ